YEYDNRSAQKDQVARYDQGDHRTRHARRVLVGGQDFRYGTRTHHRVGSATGNQGRSARAGSLSGWECGMSVVTEDRAAAPRPQTAAADQPFFAVRDIHAYYGESYIVQGVSLEVRKGEILALLGRNGAGKTST